MRFSQDHVRGWNAAMAGEPFDRSESDAWKEGYRLHQSHQETRRVLRLCGLSPAQH